MARLVLPIFLVISLTLLHQGYSHPSRTRKAVPAPQRGNTHHTHYTKLQWLYYVFLYIFSLTCLSACLCFYGDTAADEDDVKSQLEKLWQEVNSLKEISALQTGIAGMAALSAYTEC